MEFKKREEYSMDTRGDFYQISQDEFVHCTDHDRKVIKWTKGNKCTEQQFEFEIPFGILCNSFFFKKNQIIKKAELRNDQIVIVDDVKIEKGIKFHFEWHCLHYFIERDNNPNVSFAIPINEDYRSTNGFKFNVSIDELKKYYQIHVHDNFLFGIVDNGMFSPSSIRRYQSDSEEYLEKKELPDIWCRSVIFNNWIFYLNHEADLISVNITDLTYEIMNTKIREWSIIVGIDENGMVNLQTWWKEAPVHLLTAKLPKKYMVG